jgi:hypothetical protein
MLDGYCAVPNPVYAHWSRDVFDLLFAKVLECVIEFVADVIAHHPRDADPARLGNRLQKRGDIHAVAEDGMFLDDHVVEVDPGAKFYPCRWPRTLIALGHRALDLHSAADGIHDTGELRQEGVAGVLYDPAPMLADLRIDQSLEVGFEALPEDDIRLARRQRLN